MPTFKDPMRLTRVAAIIVAVHMALQLLYGLMTAIDYVRSPGPFLEQDAMLSGLTAIPMFLSLIASYVVVGMWTYRTNGNAHVLSEQMTISPGWAVGWHFIPIANLFKPFQAMKEAWMASHYRGDWQSMPTPPLMFGWWTLWIATSILSGVSTRLALDGSFGAIPDEVVYLDVMVSLLNVPLCLILIALMRRLAKAQLLAFHNETFA